ncbi:MAG: 5'/3'-nucleotidase SurE [Fervidicoccaceae archaeon]
MKKRIVITNDDGVYSPGLKILHDSVSDLGEVHVIAPETPKSSTGLGLTLHKPLRVMRVKLWNEKSIIAVSGTPSDIIHISVHILNGKPDLVLSGINVGDNTSLQVILSSGTVGAAMQASLLGIPSAAFSADVKSPEEFMRRNYRKALEIVTRTIAEHLLEKGMPKGFDLISVNFPSVIGKKTKVKIAKPARIRFAQYTERRIDPQGRPYFWIYGEPTSPEEGTDAYIVLVEKNIALTPISLNLSSCSGSEDEAEPLRERAEENLREKML